MPEQLPSGAGAGAGLADQVGRETATVRWLAPEEIRARGRRRNRIRAVVGTVAVVAVVAVGSVVTVGRYGPPPSPVAAPQPANFPAPATSPPDRVEIPLSALLQPEEVGPGLVVDRVEVRPDEAVQVIDPTVPLGCSGYATRTRYTGLARMTRRHTVQQPPAVPGDPLSGAAVVHEEVFRLGPDAARQVFADARAVPDLCAEYVSAGAIEIDGERLAVAAVHRWRMLAEGFAGDESVLLDWQTTIRRQDDSTVVDGPASRLVGVVRVADLVARVDRADESADPERGRALVRAAAARLCTAANPRC
ncbi:hypothetical protein O7626_00995 [Micromonospora sp. WMMD1102]|uniref:hypothetical protein n=1 Tax=Micromonospora sp. WMMD1102 TaxID=3016105 RepID=UPI002415074E|nr:hypothetical protein [Micromonospora sp. WMMD1102]MDG4784524.1 hypothetical protein [Micromonospora sp. WMMD1102]